MCIRDRQQAEREENLKKRGIRRVDPSEQQQPKRDKSRFQKAGERGRRFEGRLAKLFDALHGKGISGKDHKVLGGSMKTDIVDGDGLGYSVKTKMNNKDPMKIQQSNHDSTLWSKLSVPWAQRATAGSQDFQKSLLNNKLAQALILKFGSKEGSLSHIGDLIADELSPAQQKMLKRFHEQTGDQKRIKSNPFLTNQEMQDSFPEQYEALMGHLGGNKERIFNALVRQAGGQNGDKNPIQRFVSHITDAGVNGGVLDVDDNDEPIFDFNGTLDIHDMSDERVRDAMEAMQWFSDGNRFYLAPEETDDTDQRMLDIWPYDEEGTSWALRQGDGNRQSPITPGYFKATMASDRDFLERFFPSLIKGRINFDRATKQTSFHNEGLNRNESIYIPMNFSKLHLSEATTPADVKALSSANSEKAVAGGQIAKEKQNVARADQAVRSSAKKGLGTQSSEIGKEIMEDRFRSLRTQKELIHMREQLKSDWRGDLSEAMGPEEEGNHPYVEVMPDTNYKAKELAKQIKDARSGAQAKQDGQSLVNKMPIGEDSSPAWQRKEGKNESGGLNQKGVDSYKKENPGSELKTAVTTDPSKLKKGSKSANRRKSFCSRMKGMKSKLTSEKTANDPDSRINKSLRKWNC